MLFDCFVYRPDFKPRGMVKPFQVDLPLKEGEDFMRDYIRNTRLVLRAYLSQGIMPVFEPYDTVLIRCSPSGPHSVLDIPEWFQVSAYFSEAYQTDVYPPYVYPSSYQKVYDEGNSSLRELKLTRTILVGLGFQHRYNGMYTAPCTNGVMYELKDANTNGIDWMATLPLKPDAVIRTIKTIGELYDFHKGMTGVAFKNVPGKTTTTNT